MPPKKGSKKKKDPELQEPEHDGSWEKVCRALESRQICCFLDGSDCRRCGTVDIVLASKLQPFCQI